MASDMRLLREKILFVARSNLGYGEETGNNEGAFIDAIGGRNKPEWCALFGNYCIRRGFELLYGWPKASFGYSNAPWLYRRPGLPEPGAKRLIKAIGARGRGYKDPAQALPGDFVCWSRGTLGWQGHFGIVEAVDSSGIVATIEGNVGRFPSRVRRFMHDVSKERLYTFASLEK